MQSYLGKEVELRGIVDVGGICTNPENDWIKEVFEIMEKFLEDSPTVSGATYFTDASVLTPSFNHSPTVIIGPGGTDHSSPERRIMLHLQD